MIGVYSITSPSGKVYVGSSKDIKKRWKAYYSLSCKNQVKLYRSLVKHGIDNHLFKIEIECSIEELFEWEHHYSNYYSSITKGLNCRIPNFGTTKGIVSQDSIKRMIDNHPKNNESWMVKTRERLLRQMADPTIKVKMIEGRKRWMESVNFSEIIKERYRNMPIEKRKEARDKCKATMIAKNNGSYHSQQFKDNLSKRVKGVPHTEEHKKKLKQNWESRRPLITDITTGIEYKNIDELCDAFNISKWSLWPKLTGRRPNNTNFRYKESIGTPTAIRKKGKKRFGVVTYSKKVIDTRNNKIYNSIKECSIDIEIPYNKIIYKMSIKKSPIMLLELWEQQENQQQY
jgi:hypothetical protein